MVINMYEYEYSFNVKSTSEYINFCKKNNFKLISKFKQTRIIYRNPNKTIARITIEEGNKINKVLDFKEDKLTNNDLNIRKESKALKFEDNDAVQSILEFLNYSKDNTLIRNRIIYIKEDVKFEIDEYEYPSKSYVVAIEGDKEQVDLIYNKLSEINKIYKI